MVVPANTRTGASTMFLKTIAAAAALSGVAAVAALPASAGQTFDAVKAKGFVQCAVNTGLAGFFVADSHGKGTGIHGDLLPALALGIVVRGRECQFTPSPR